jgi:hypothetical protein
MFEQEGTTPASQDSTTQLVNAVETRQATLEEQAKQIIELTKDKDYWHQKHLALSVKVDTALEAFKEILDGDMDSEQTIKDFDEVIKALDWKLTKDVQVTVTATWSGTISMPYGTDLADISIRFQDPEIDEPNMDMDLGWGPDDYTVEED